MTATATPAGATLGTALTATDRCDRCGAQAYVRVTLLTGGDLLFCGHHGRKFEPELRKVAAHIHDESGRLAVASPQG